MRIREKVKEGFQGGGIEAFFFEAFFIEAFF